MDYGDNKKVLIATKKGRMKKVSLDEVKEMGRYAKGSRFITLDEGDEVVQVKVVEE